MGEAVGYGALLGGLFGSTTFIFQGEPFGIPLGLGFGFVYGLAFGLGGWLIGWLLFHSRLLSRKGSSLGWGVVTASFIYPMVLWLIGGTLDAFVILTPAGIAGVTGLLRGKWYDTQIAGPATTDAARY
jgi:hypothetical protein